MVTNQLVLLFLACLLSATTGYRRLATRSHQSYLKFYNDTFNELSDVVSDNEENRRSLADASHFVSSLPGLEDSNLSHYAGHVTIDESKGSNIFYWLFEAPQNAETLPLLIWMNGGPGCSSMDGLWLELGPLRLEKSGDRVFINPHSWHNVANVLFVDQPVGTGFAYTKSKNGYANSDEAVNEQFYKFLLGFFELHPRYVDTVDGRSTTRAFFMSGESHAGHYIPSMAAYIVRQNEKIKRGGSTEDPIVALEGIALGNPWLDPYYQYDASEFAHGLGLISLGQKHRLKELEAKCQSLLKAGKYNNAACFSLLDKIVDSTAVGAAQRVLMYDTRQFVKQTSSFPPGHEPLERYLNRVDVKTAIHATSAPQKFEECANPPFYALAHQDGKGITKELTWLLDGGLRVLVFAGQYDLICNHMGIEKVLRRLAWKGQKDWLLAAPGTWAMDGRPVGFVRAHSNLEFLIVLDAGHMVPMDQPAVALSMIRTFLQNRRFATTTSQAKLGAALDAPGGDSDKCPRGISAGVVALEQQKAGSTGLVSSAGRLFWPTGGGAAQGKGWGGQYTRRQRQGRRAGISGDVVSNPQTGKRRLQEEENSAIWGTGAVDRRSLLGNTTAPKPTAPTLPFALVLGHVTALNGSALAHVRLTHQGHAAHLQHHHHTDHASIATALTGHLFEIAVQPGYGAVQVAVASLLSNKHLTTDITIPGLRDGVEYSFTTFQVDPEGGRHQSSRRVVTATPGCFDPSALQCCGNGRCGAVGEASYCHCDPGWTGPRCDQIIPHKSPGETTVHSIEATVTCPAHFHGHVELLQNISSLPTAALVTVSKVPASSAENATAVVQYCSPASAVCRLSVQLAVDLDSAHGRAGSISWPTHRSTARHYDAALVALLEADVRAALARAVLGQDVDDILSISLGGATVESGDELMVGSLDGEKGAVTRVTVGLIGPAKRLDAVAAQLVESLEHPASVLRTEGVLGRYLSQDVVVVRHKSTQGQDLTGALRSRQRADPPTVRPESTMSNSLWVSIMMLSVAGCAVVYWTVPLRRRSAEYDK